MALPLLPIAAGVGVAAILGYLLMKSSGAASVSVPTAATPAKNVVANKALGTEYASGKTAGFAQGGTDSTSGAGESLNPEETPVAISASKTTADPASFLSGYKDGYGAGFAAAEAAKKISSYAVTTPDEAPPPPPEPPATPPGKPKAYVANPSTTGYNTGYGSGLTYGKNNKTDYAPGGGGANGVKSSDSAAASKTFDDAQMTLWSSNWDLGYQYGWDTGQSKYHSAGGGGSTAEFSSSSDASSSDATDTRSGFVPRPSRPSMQSIGPGRPPAIGSWGSRKSSVLAVVAGRRRSRSVDYTSRS